MLSPTILFSQGGAGAREGAQWCSLMRFIRSGARTMPSESIFSTRAPSEHEYLQLGSMLNDKRRAPAPLRAVAFNPGAAKRAGGAGAAQHWVSLRVALGSFI